MNSLINCYFKNNSHTSKLQAFTADRINMTLKCAVTMSNEYQELLISDSPKINLVRNAEKNQSFIKFYFWVISQQSEKVTQCYILSHYHQKIIICDESAPYAS